MMETLVTNQFGIADFRDATWYIQGKTKISRCVVEPRMSIFLAQLGIYMTSILCAQPQELGSRILQKRDELVVCVPIEGG
jgi:hypothetical protein